MMFDWFFRNRKHQSREATAQPRRYQYQIFADYHQFYIQDDDSKKGNLAESWDQAATERLLAVAPYAIGIGTARNTVVPLTVEICPSRPDISLDQWQQVNLCSLRTETGRLVVAGCTDYFRDAARISVTPGIYQAIVCYKGLDTISSDGLHGDDSYHVFLFPGDECEVSVLKKRSGD